MPDLGGVESRIRALTSALIRDLAASWRAIRAERDRLYAAWPGEDGPTRRRRLVALEQTVTSLMTDARGLVQLNLPTVLRDALMHGVQDVAKDLGTAIAQSGIDTSALLTLTTDAYDDLLAATTHVEETTKELIRVLARDRIRDKLVEGQTPEQAARRLAADLADQSITAVVYKDGSRHGLADYADMVIRTKSAEAYQRGAIGQAIAHGIEYVEILDGPACGLDGHDDLLKANGLILPISVGALYPLSHPRCVRATTPVVDVRSDAEARAASNLTEADWTDLLAREPVTGGTSDLLNGRSARLADGTLASPAVVSKAQARNAARQTKAAAAADGTSPAQKRFLSRLSRRGG